MYCEERWFCVLLRCDSSFSWRGTFELGKTSHLFIVPKEEWSVNLKKVRLGSIIELECYDRVE